MQDSSRGTPGQEDPDPGTPLEPHSMWDAAFSSEVAAGALDPLDDALEMRRRVDRALDTAARRLCGGVLLVVLLFVAYFAGNRHCLPDSSGNGCGSLRWVAVTLKRQLPSKGAAPDVEGGGGRPPHAACNDALHVDRVALLFLSRGALHHEGLWEAWLAGAGGSLPLQTAQGSACSPTLVAGACSSAASEGAVGRQFLFSVYTHPAPSFSFGEGSIFSGHEIAERVPTGWGAISLTWALQRLLAAALREPRNQRFVLLSESGVPLYPALVVYQALMGEPRSRVAACLDASLPPPGRETAEEMAWPVANGSRPAFTFSHWRKSSQWVGLVRPHAQLIADDRDVIGAFHEFCAEPGSCLSEEHYVPGFLSYLGLENETDCVGGMTAAEWALGGSHPKSFEPEEVTAALLHQMRGGKDCKSEEAISLGMKGFVAVGDLVRAGGCQGSAEAGLAGQGSVSSGPGAFRWQPELLGPQCALFARKFPAATAEAVRKLDIGGEAAEKKLTVAAQAPASDQADSSHVRT